MIRLLLPLLIAAIDYRIVPAVTVEQQAQDVANAVAALRGQATKLGFDSNPHRVDGA